MINQKSIERYVDYQPVLVKQTFAALLDNKSTATQNAVSSFSDRVKVFLNRAGIATVSTENWFADVSEEFDIDSLMDILRGESLKETQTFAFKLQKVVFGWALDRLLGYVLDLNFSHLSYSDRMSVGDGLYLAALHKEAVKKTAKTRV
jgi:hypothetical protein